MGLERLKSIWQHMSGRNKITCGKSGMRTLRLSQSDRNVHAIGLGASGCGKSQFARQLALGSLSKGEGLGIVDPKGDLYKDLLKDLYHHVREQKVIQSDQYVLFDPTSTERLPGFNPLEVEEGVDPYPQCLSIVEILRKQWSDFFGPRMSNLLRNSFVALMENDLTFLEVEKFLTDPDFREMLVKDLNNEQVKHFWLERYPSISPDDRARWVEPVLNKIGAFVASPVISEIIGQKNSTIDFRRILDEGKTLLVNLPKSKLGPQVAYLLGALIVGEINQAAISRSDLPEEERNQYFLHVDEFQHYASPSFSSVLSEARGFSLSLFLYTQDFEGISDELQASILANAKALFSFRVSREDAEIMAKHLFESTGLTKKFVPEKDSWGKPKSNPSYRSIQEEREEKINELTSLPNRKLYMRIRGKGDPKLMRTITTPEYDIPRAESDEFAEKLMKPYTKRREEIREEIEDRRSRLEERTEQAVLGG